jgi:hypothetical protein
MNQAAELGPQKFPWWPDWRGECAAIVASGPSMKKLDVSMLKDRIHVIAIKSTIDKCPWAEVCYGCDAAWWLARKGLPSFKGTKIFHGIAAANQWPDLHRTEIRIDTDAMLVEKPLEIGNGGNSGFQAVNLAIQFGATDIVLLGMDCHDRGGVHWYGRNNWLNASNPMMSNFNRWRSGFKAAQKSINKLGVTVVDATTDGELNCFRKAGLAEVLEEWGL